MRNRHPAGAGSSLLRLFAVVAVALCVSVPSRGNAGDQETAPGPHASAPDFASLRALFDYDPGARLDLQVTGAEVLSKEGVTIEQVTYASPIDGRVTATVVASPRSDLPGRKESARRAGIIFMHWGQGDRSEFIWEATLLARSGAVCVLVDAPWARPQPWKQVGEDLSQPDLTRKMYIQNTVDLRRAVDVLLARGDVDPERIAYVGHSFGATQGGLLAGVEKRIKTFVLMGGLPSLIDPSFGGARNFDDYIAAIRERVPAEMWQKYCDAIGPLTPAAFVAHAAPSSILMQFATDDSWISRKAAETYFTAASEPKAIRWYRSAHDFNNLEALVDRALWLKKEIGIRSILPRLRRILSERE